MYPYWTLPKNKLLKDRAKELRKAGILSEVLFWQTFKDKQKFGFDLDRQVIIGNYIVDFLIPELGLVFEIDGSSHDGRIEYDKNRDFYLSNLQLKVVRIFDADVKNNMPEVYNYILKAIEERKEELKKSFHPASFLSTPQEGN